MKVESNYRRWNERAVPSSVMTLEDGEVLSPSCPITSDMGRGPVLLGRRSGVSLIDSLVVPRDAHDEK